MARKSLLFVRQLTLALLLLLPGAAALLAGGQRAVDDLNDDGVLNAAKFAASWLSGQRETVTLGAPVADGAPRALSLHRVLAARTQVVSGVNYILSLELRLRASEPPEEGCQLHDVTVWHVPWQQKFTLTKQTVVRAGVEPCSREPSEL